jgi:HK97 family phage prohead protease
VSGLINIDVRDWRALERGHGRAERCQSGGYRNAIYNNVKDRALDGQAIRFNVPVPYNGTLIMFEPDAFGDIERHTVAFCIDHLETTEVASTDNGLSLIVDDDAIQFRLDLEQATNGYVVAHLCEIGNREATSIGFEILDERTKTIAGHSVRIISRAKLREISICKNGAAGDNAFAYLVDTTVTPKPVAGARSKKFETYNAMYKLSRKVREIKATNAAVLALHERIAGLDVGSQCFDWSMDVHQSNRFETEKYDRLQSARRAMLGM